MQTLDEIRRITLSSLILLIFFFFHLAVSVNSAPETSLANVAQHSTAEVGLMHSPFFAVM